MLYQVSFTFTCFLMFVRAGKTVWERKWVVLRDNKLSIYNSREESTSGRTVDEFDLCPHNGVVSVRSAVAQTELPGVSISELLYVMMLEFEPDTANMSNRFTLFIFLKLVAKRTAPVPHICSRNVTEFCNRCGCFHC